MRPTAKPHMDASGSQFFDGQGSTKVEELASDGFRRARVSGNFGRRPSVAGQGSLTNDDRSFSPRRSVKDSSISPLASPGRTSNGSVSPAPNGRRRMSDPSVKAGLALAQPRAQLEADSPSQPVVDQFGEILNELNREHRETVERLMKENADLKYRLNSVINATWSVSQDGCQSKPMNRGEAGNLRLTLHDPNEVVAPATDDPVWTVDNSFRDVKKHEQELKEELKNPKKRTKFNARTNWKHGADKTKHQGDPITRGTSWNGQRFSHVSSMNSESEERREGNSWCSRKVILHPAGNRRLAWDVAGVFLLFYDVLVVPLGAFGVDEVSWIATLDTFVLCFWTLDIFASLLTGYITDNGTVVMKPLSIAEAYLRSRWFLLDLLVVGPDWVFTLIVATSKEADGTSSADVTGLLRIFRLIRIIRLLRVQKIRRIMTYIQDSIESEVVFFVTRLSQLVTLLVLGCHFMASGWYFVGDIGLQRGLQNEENWIEAFDVEHRKPFYKYLTSLHWALANFSPAATANVYPVNSGERVFSVVSTTFGMIVICLLTAFTTSAIINLQKSNDEINKQFWLLRKYMSQQSVPHQLKARILRYLTNKVGTRRDLIQETRLEVLSMLTESLRCELKYVVKFSDLLTHPLFAYIDNHSAVIMHQMAKSVLQQKHMACFDVLFQRGSVATGMSYLKAGELEYTRPSSTASVVQKDDWLCEMTLWVPWAARGNCQAASDCEIISVAAREFGEIMQEDAPLMTMMCAYAEIFAKWLSEVESDDLTDHFTHRKTRQLIEDFMFSSKKKMKEDDRQHGA